MLLGKTCFAKFSHLIVTFWTFMEIKFQLHNCGKTRIKKTLQTDISTTEAKEQLFRAVEDLALALTTFKVNADLIYLEN